MTLEKGASAQRTPSQQLSVLNLRPESMNISTLLSLEAHIKDIIWALNNIEG